jgi:hypothetical protein
MDIIKKMYKTHLILLLIFIVIIIAAAFLLRVGKATQPKPFVVNKGPLDIRLVGVCPDGGEQIYDASGRKLKTTMEALGPFNTNWKNEEQCRDFVFEVPDVNSQVVFVPVSRIWIAGINRGLSGGYGGYFGPTDNPPTLIRSITFDRSYKRQVLYFFQAQNEIHQIDLTLRYLYGPRREATCTFTGPFILGQTTQADSNSPYSLTPVQSKGFPRYSGTDLLLATSQPFDSDTIVVAYDLQGRRYLLDNIMGVGGSRGAISFRDVRLPLNEIAVITIGEKPYEITFKNIAVDYPDLPHRTYPEFLDQMSERLGLAGVSPEKLSQYKFKSQAEAIDVIDIVRGFWHVRQVYEAIRHGKPKIDITKLDEATQDKIHRAATEWAKTRYLAKYGISLGLMGRWPEFFDKAIERLGREITYGDRYPYSEQTWRQDNAEIAGTMVIYEMDQLTVEQVQKIKELILKTDNDSVLKRLLWYLVQTKSQATTDALWELAQNEKPWMWWQATEAWYSRTSRTHGVYDDLSEKMKLRLILIKDKIRDENLDEKALKLLPEIFTVELGKMASDVWNKVRERISREFDRKVATEIFVDYLRQLQSEMTARQWISNSSFKSKSKWMTAYIIRTLNVWYGTNIASLGTDETRESSNQEPRSFYEFQNLIAQPIQWYDDNKQAEPVDLPFAGKILDTAGNPIAGAKLSFTKREDYEDEQGYQGQRTVDVGQCTTDDTGKFSFGDLTTDRYVTFNVIADGYLMKEELRVHRLTDGRYRYDEQNAPQDNVIVLQRSGKISGIVLGADGKPLANAELRLCGVDRYSQKNPIKTITTNSEGKFIARDISKGHFLLSYTGLKMVPYGQGFRQEYEGRCGAVSLEAEEAGHLTDVVLDLSKSDCSLALHVVNDANKPVQDINISFGTEMEGSAYKYAAIFSIRKVSRDGVYCFEGMPPGAWCLYVSDGSLRFEQKKIYVKLSRKKTAYYKVVRK